MRPGYLGNLENFWFGDEENKAEEKEAEISMSRLVTSAGAANFKPATYLRNHPLFKKYWKPLKVDSPRDLPISLTKASKETAVEKYYKPDTGWGKDADQYLRSKSWT